MKPNPKAQGFFDSPFARCEVRLEKADEASALSANRPFIEQQFEIALLIRQQTMLANAFIPPVPCLQRHSGMSAHTQAESRPTKPSLGKGYYLRSSGARLCLFHRRGIRVLYPPSQ